MKNMISNKLWKRNAVVAAVLLFVCAGIYLNWSYQKREQTEDLTEVLNQDLIMSDTALVIGTESVSDEDLQTAMASIDSADTSSEYFAQIRLNRQESRDSAVNLLQETIAYESGADDAAASAASNQLAVLVNRAIDEAEVESLLIAKGYEDCVCFMNDDSVSVAVNAPMEGLSESAVAAIADAVLSQSEYQLSDIRVVEVH